MTHQITCCYETVRQVAGLEAELKTNGFKNAQVLPNAAIPNSGSAESLANAIAQLGILRATASRLAELIRKGGAVAIVPAHFGTGGKANEILGKYNPIAAKPAETPDNWDAAAPFSSLLRLPVLKTEETFTGHSGKPLIVEQKGDYASFSGEPLVLKQNGSYRSMSGTPLLLKDGPYKSYSGTPLLVDQPGEYKSFSGTPLLLDSRTLFLTRA